MIESGEDRDVEPEPGEPEDVDNGIRCRLIRRDGTEWEVTEFQASRVPPRISARLVNGNGHADDEGYQEDLLDQPLSRGDRMEWLDEDGRVLWAYRAPLDTDDGSVPRNPNPDGASSRERD